MKKLLLIALALLSGCAAPLSVRQPDLDAWVGMPVEALDTHSFFLTMQLVKTMTSSGVEVRNYVNNGAEIASCGSYGFSSASATTNCISSRVTCNNIFYVRDGKVLEYAPTGQCFTDASVLPQQRYLKLRRAS